MKLGSGTLLAAWLRQKPILSLLGYFLLLVFFFVNTSYSHAQTQQQSDSVGIEGRVPSDPPSQAPVITVPSNGQTFSQSPITIAGLCARGYLVEVFKNGVFAGSVECVDGSFSLQIDLFDGRNDIIARLYDALNQAGPDSNTITVTYNSSLPGSGPKVFITTSFAKRGAPPGTTLTWPLSLSGGTGPYAVSVDWGDKSSPDLISRPGVGDFVIEHIYTQAGTYNVIIKVTDANGDTAYLQVVGVGNGPIQQANSDTKIPQADKVERVILWWPFILTLLLTIVAFWLGQRHQLQVIRDRLRRGERPFK
ncbi:hypothetical protein H0X09_01295 [Candidatus Saccharibacteria bacterium]|nr:hypothetical protein [Candidatus Saccharibacteria bacterium]